MGWGLAVRGLFTHNKETEPMFQQPEPDANDNPETEALPLPPSGANDRRARPLTPEKVRHLLYGSLAALDRTIKILHALGYADPNDWSDPLPVPPSAAELRSLRETEPRSSSGVETTWMVIMTKTVLIE
jgi:hypothetical protein